ncbi:MAG TPA: putative DNA-binding domain-containing protein [Polyangiales bacterium]|nr:putative DNA-binding domain-containing protein [Polyangiales bacterium]
MALIDVERAVLSVCFRAEPPEAALELLGERERWLLYRELTRERLWRELEVALPRTCAALGPEIMQRTFVQHLDRDPPRTRYFREIVAAFAASALGSWEGDASLPDAARDLLRYEAALWEVSDLEVGAPAGSVEFAFDRVPVVSGALRLLRLEHGVHLPPEQDGQCRRGEFWLCVQRGPNDARPQTWRFNRTTFALLADFVRGDVTAAQSVQRVAEQLGAKVSERFVERLCEALAQWIDVGILLGSR